VGQGYHRHRALPVRFRRTAVGSPWPGYGGKWPAGRRRCPHDTAAAASASTAGASRWSATSVGWTSVGGIRGIPEPTPDCTFRRIRSPNVGHAPNHESIDTVGDDDRADRDVGAGRDPHPGCLSCTKVTPASTASGRLGETDPASEGCRDHRDGGSDDRGHPYHTEKDPSRPAFRKARADGGLLSSGITRNRLRSAHQDTYGIWVGSTVDQALSRSNLAQRHQVLGVGAGSNIPYADHFLARVRGRHGGPRERSLRRCDGPLRP
jgi:hypothetical protein